MPAKEQRKRLCIWI